MHDLVHPPCLCTVINLIKYTCISVHSLRCYSDIVTHFTVCPSHYRRWQQCLAWAHLCPRERTSSARRGWTWWGSCSWCPWSPCSPCWCGVMGAGNNKAVEKLTHNVCRVHRVASEPVSIIFIYFLRRASPALLSAQPGYGPWLGLGIVLLAAAHDDVLFRNLYNSLEKLHEDQTWFNTIL